MVQFVVVIVLMGAPGSAIAEPTELGSAQLDQITAGTQGTDSNNPAPNGGAIVGNDSQAVLNSVGEVTLDGEAQASAMALNLVNSSESTVANGVNIFDGEISGDAVFEGTTFNIDQKNSIQQDQRRLSSLPHYTRGANSESTFLDSGSSEHSWSIVEFDQVVDLEQTIIIDDAMTDGSYDRSGAPTLKIVANAKIEIPDVIDFDGDIDVEFNMPSAGNSIGVVFNGEIDVLLDAGEVLVDSGLGVTVRVDLPSIDLEFDAMGCVALNGNCSIVGSRTESEETISDHSTLYTLDEAGSDAETYTNSGGESAQAPFELRDAQAEYIVIDDSTIEVSATYLVALAGSAQSNLRAMNVVNAAGSAVANGVNISRQSAGSLSGSNTPVYNLTQINEIRHSR